MIKGRKNDTMLIFVSATEGCGKSFFTSMLIELMGHLASCRPTPKQIIEFNTMTLGKFFVNIEETGDKADFTVFVQKIKGMITDTHYTYEGKHTNAIIAPCVSNFMITSNFQINLLSGRRDLNITPSTLWLGETEKFNKLLAHTEEDMQNVFNFFYQKDTSNFRGQKDKPDLMSNQMKIIENMNNVWHYVKMEIYMNLLASKKPQIIIKKTDSYEKYKAFLEILKDGKYACSKSNFFEKIKELNVEEKRMTDGQFFVFKLKELQHEFNKRKLLSPEDDIAEFEKIYLCNPFKTENKKEALERTKEELEIELEDKDKKIKELMKRLELLENSKALD